MNGRLENWYQSGPAVFGHIFDDPGKRFNEGYFIRTSTASAEGLKEGDILKTKNSEYLLGKPLNDNLR